MRYREYKVIGYGSVRHTRAKDSTSAKREVANQIKTRRKMWDKTISDIMKNLKAVRE